MKKFEITLKIAFLLGSAFAIKVESVSFWFLLSYLLVCLVLGIVLIFNKDSSYNSWQSKYEYPIRRFEGGLLIAFAIFVAWAQIF